MVERAADRAADKRGEKIVMCKKKRGSRVHIYKVADDTQTGQVSKDTRGGGQVPWGD